MADRRTIDERYTWDLTTIFKNDEAWESALASFQKDLTKVTAYQGHLLDDAKTFKKISDSQLNLAKRLETLYVYASMKNDQDTREAKYQSYYAQVMSAYSDFSKAFAFYEPELLAISKEMLEQFYQEEPALRLYSHQLEVLLSRKKHVLSQEVEEVLAATSELFSSPSETYEILDTASISFDEVADEDGHLMPLTHGTFNDYMESSDRHIRLEAYENLYSRYEQFQHTYAKTLAANVKSQTVMANLRHYKNARQAALSHNAIPESVYDTLVTTVHQHLPLLHRYMALRKQILQLEDLKMYDVYAPLSQVDMRITYEEAVARAKKALSFFGKDYEAIVMRAFNERWIDVMQNDGKRTGAYSGGSYETNPFILLNWSDTLDNLFTLVHEMGHSVHSAFSREHQPYVYGNYPIFLAEIASTTNENVLTEYLLQEVTEPKERFAILNHYLDGFKGTVFRQTQFAEFEAFIHAAEESGKVLTADYLNQCYGQLNETYYGIDLETDPLIQYEWARIPHFYYNFYVFQYATGFAAASSLTQKMVTEGEAAIANYKEFLKAGSSDFPLEIIKKAGVDMLDATYLEDAFALFETRLSEVEGMVARGLV